MFERVKRFLRRGTDFYFKFIHKSREQKQKPYEWTGENREKMVEINPIAKRLVVDVANLITARPPIFLDKNGNELQKLQNQWVEKLYNDLLKDCIIATRTHGFAITEFLKNPIGDHNWLVHDVTEIIEMRIKEDYQIDYYRILPRIESTDNNKVSLSWVPTQKTLYPDKVIHYFIGKFKLDRTGLATLSAVWDSLIKASSILESMTIYDARIGSGIPTVSIERHASSDRLSALEKALESASNRGWLILEDKRDNEPTEVKWTASTGSVDYSEHLTMCLKVIAGATGFPVRFFIGDPKGALSAASEDTKATWENLKSIFGEYKAFIRKVLLMMENGEALNAQVAEIEFDDGGNLQDDEEQKPEENEWELKQEQEENGDIRTYRQKNIRSIK